MKKSDIKKYYSKQASIKVLGALCKNPKLLNRGEYPLEVEDFIGDTHIILFSVIYNLNNQGVEKIDISDIESYLNLISDSRAYNLFFAEKNRENLDWLYEVLEESVDNFNYYYDIVRKFSILREYLYNGIDITYLYNIDELDPYLIEQQNNRFNNMSIQDIIREIDKKTRTVKDIFTGKMGEESLKVGDCVDELLEELRESPSVGWNTESKYLTTIINGMSKGEFILEIRDSGTGKTRVGIKRAIMYSAPEYWDFQKKDFVKNSCFTPDNGTIFFNTEMKPKEEIVPIILGFLSGIPSGKIKRQRNSLTREEEMRLQRAKEISKQMPFYIVKESDYNIQFLKDMIEKYQSQNNIGLVILDYIEETPSLMQEYQQKMKTSVSSYQMLNNLSKELKNMAVDYDVCMVAMSQASGEAKMQNLRDANASAGSKSLVNKTDYGISVFSLTESELKKIESLCSDKFTPNQVISVFKGRDSEYPRAKIFLSVNLGNGCIIDGFVTDWSYKKMAVSKTWVTQI
jgi:replicative DNA helicase